MLRSLVRIRSVTDAFRDAERDIKMRVASMAAGPQVTQRVRGDELEAVVTKADVSWDGAKLKRVWEEAPEQIRNEILRISEVKVNERTWSVWEKTTGSEEFERWKLALKAACKGRTGLPTVKVVESSKANKLSDMF